MHTLYFGCLATDLHDFFIDTLLCVAMVTILVKDIPQNVSLSAAYCYSVYMSITMFALIAFD